MLTLGRQLMGADNQAESVPERKRLSAIAKMDLAWCSVTGVPMEHIVLTRQQAEELVAEFERFSSQGGKSDLGGGMLERGDGGQKSGAR
jgi:hypothetical protein